MAPQSVIGAAAPIMLSPGGTGVETMPDTMEVKTASAISALVRANAEKNGHNTEVADAMVKKTKELKIDGKVLNEKGQILTLTNLEAEKEYSQPPKPLLSAGTVESLDALLKQLGAADATVTRIEPTGAEKLATWINAISPILLILGAAGLYIEFKTPGFGLPGIIGIGAFVIYFLGGYVAGLSGMEWLLVFVIGVALLAVELFVFPGTMVSGLIGMALIAASLLMAAVDWYPGTPSLPTLPQLQLPLRNLLIAAAGSTAVMWALSIWLPRSAYFERLVPRTASGVASVEKKAAEQAGQIGLVGVAVSPLRPGGKAQFGEQILDVITDGGMIARGARVKIIRHSGPEAVVEAVDEGPAQS
jgi:membrane-bound serine protease (ClpP class)